MGVATWSRAFLASHKTVSISGILVLAHVKCLFFFSFFFVVVVAVADFLFFFPLYSLNYHLLLYCFFFVFFCSIWAYAFLYSFLLFFFFIVVVFLITVSFNSSSFFFFFTCGGCCTAYSAMWGYYFLYYYFIFRFSVHHWDPPFGSYEGKREKKRAFCLLNQFNSIPLFVFRHLNEGECSGTV